MYISRMPIEILERILELTFENSPCAPHVRQRIEERRPFLEHIRRVYRCAIASDAPGYHPTTDPENKAQKEILTLVRAQVVCKLFRDTIQGSLRLQRLMGVVPFTEGQPYIFNPVFFETIDGKKEELHIDFALVLNFLALEKRGMKPLHDHLPKRIQALMRPEASWRKMQLKFGYVDCISIHRNNLFKCLDRLREPLLVTNINDFNMENLLQWLIGSEWHTKQPFGWKLHHLMDPKLSRLISLIPETNEKSWMKGLHHSVSSWKAWEDRYFYGRLRWNLNLYTQQEWGTRHTGN